MEGSEDTYTVYAILVVICTHGTLKVPRSSDAVSSPGVGHGCDSLVAVRIDLRLGCNLRVR